MKLPIEIWNIIFLKCRKIELLKLKLTCKKFLELIESINFELNYKYYNTYEEELKQYFEYCNHTDFYINDIILIIDNYKNSKYIDGIFKIINKEILLEGSNGFYLYKLTVKDLIKNGKIPTYYIYNTFIYGITIYKTKIK